MIDLITHVEVWESLAIVTTFSCQVPNVSAERTALAIQTQSKQTPVTGIGPIIYIGLLVY